MHFINKCDSEMGDTLGQIISYTHEHPKRNNNTNKIPKCHSNGFLNDIHFIEKYTPHVVLKST